MFRTARAPKFKRILITRTDRIGDVILSTPVFAAIKAKRPDIYLAAMVLKETEPAVRNCPSLDRVIVYDKKGARRSWWSTAAFALELRKERFDAVIHLHPTNRVHVISYMAGIPVRIGWRAKNHWLLTETLEETKWQGRMHEAEYNFELLALVGIEKPPVLSLYFYLDPAEKKNLKELLAPWLGLSKYFVVHPSASCESKIWPAEFFAELSDRFAGTSGARAVLVGEGAGVTRAAKVEAAMRLPCVNLAGKLSLGQLGRLIKNAALLVSNDSGPVHIAAAVGTPVVSIFGRNQAGLGARRWRPISERSSFVQKDAGCIECLAHDCKLGFKCLRELSVEDVFDEVSRVVGEIPAIPQRRVAGDLWRHELSLQIQGVSSNTNFACSKRSTIDETKRACLAQNKMRLLRKALIVNPFGIGDALFSTPVIRALKESGAARIDLLLGSRTAEVFSANPYVSRIFEWDKSPCESVRARLNRWRGLIRIFFEMFLARYDVFIDCSLRRPYSFWAAWIFRIPVRVGFNFKNRGLFLTHKINLPEGFSEKPVSESMLDLLKPLGIESKDSRLDFFLSEEDKKQAEAFLESKGLGSGMPFLCAAPGGGESWGADARLKRWPVEYFAEFFRNLASRYHFESLPIFILGSAKEELLGEKLKELLAPLRAENLCGLLPLRQAAALLRKALFLAANDGGLVHMASAFDIPTAAIYGPVDPAVYGPQPASKSMLAVTAGGEVRCRPCYRRLRYRADCVGIECLTQLTPDEVLKRVNENSFFAGLPASKAAR